MNKYTWIDRQGQQLDIRNMSPDYFHNLVNYLYVECQRYNLRVFRHFYEVIQEELEKRNLSISDILAEGPKAYQDKQGITRLWDENTNTELAKN